MPLARFEQKKTRLEAGLFETKILDPGFNASRCPGMTQWQRRSQKKRTPQKETRLSARFLKTLDPGSAYIHVLAGMTTSCRHLILPSL